MANRRRGFPEDAIFREIERAELTGTIRALRVQPFIFILFCAVLTLGMQRWFNRNNRLNTFWYWVLVVAAALTTFVTEYERLLRQAFDDRW
ncbi:hypothetical protein RHGRI_016545 [Rhododendron griersonianum]|uniref:Uncharacterized protein n=1 Tax=Rhododendron griersonianum TaxID=479676 RepID=A0AAV6JUF0_9ERIC|nr:hypothetical protein RHGRI_016530 [Rhododendron griersonianum]KAG5543826.1 hypothetical protein RHGRI_016545 [Rhododendron griersonianum]